MRLEAAHVAEFAVYVKRWIDGESGTVCAHSKHKDDCLGCIVHRAWYAGYAHGLEKPR